MGGKGTVPPLTRCSIEHHNPESEMTYCSLENAIHESRRLIADCGWEAVRILLIDFKPESRFGPVHINCGGWAKEYPTVVIIRPMPERN